jgi:hypothetical protein
MKKVVRRPAGSSQTVQAPAGTVSTVATIKKLDSRPRDATNATASPTPVWTRYVDSRLKQFCLR